MSLCVKTSLLSEDETIKAIESRFLDADCTMSNSVSVYKKEEGSGGVSLCIVSASSFNDTVLVEITN